jgi:hypothetical protein
VLEKCAGAFPKGLHMHVDHPTAAEESARPERSVNTIGAVLESDARWEPNGSAGPGLYAEAKPIGDFAQRLPELAPHIGVSIRALGKATQGEAEGRRGPIIQEIASAKSVDFVTVAGAGGKVLELFEAARGRLTVPQSGREERQVNEQEAQALREAAAAKETENARLAEANANLTTENARLREGALLREARDLVTETLAAIQLPDLTRARLTEALAAKPIVKDGALDRDAYKTAIAEAAKVELEYIAKLTGQGQVKGMGSPAPSDKPGSLKESWLNVYRAQGLSEAEAERRASIAAI